MSVLRKTAPLFLFLCLALACMGMGGFGDTDTVKKIPVPDRSFTVTVVDVTDTSFTVSDFSVEGLTLVPVEMGKADVAVDFAKVASARFLDKGGNLTAELTLKDGSVKHTRISRKTLFYGRTSWGLVRIEAGDVKEIRF